MNKKVQKIIIELTTFSKDGTGRKNMNTFNASDRHLGQLYPHDGC